MSQCKISTSWYTHGIFRFIMCLKVVKIKPLSRQSRKHFKILDDILNRPRSSSNKTVLGYVHNNTKEGSSSTTLKSDKDSKSYASSLKISLKKEEKNNKKIDINQYKYALLPKRNEYKRNTNTRRTPPMRYRHLFLRYCFSCNNFGHKAITYRAYGKNDHKRNRDAQNNSKM